METSTALQDQLRDFVYAGVEAEVEDLTRYKQFGLHPITLGDILPKPLTCVSDVNKEPRYRIMLKLGFGAFATVWLARDLIEKRFVALKVGLGSDNPLPNREAEILSQICKTGPGKHGYERVIQLLDVFVVEGPNGFHQCLVTEVVLPLSDPKARQHCSYDVVRQIVEGFAFLHGEDIVHGDPHIANIGIALPQLEQFEERQIIDHYANPETIPVVPRYPKIPLSSMPPYIVKSTELTEYLKVYKVLPGESVTVKIMGFGRAYRINKDPNLLGAVPKMIRPPEFVLHELCDDRIDFTWSEAADIWAVGCTLYDVKSGGELISKSTMGSLKDYLFQAIQFGGPPPETWPKVWDTQDRQHENCWYLRLASSELIRSRDTDTLAPALCDRAKVWEVREADRTSSKITHDEERLAFLNLVKRLIITKPDERTPMAVLLTDPFMVERRKEEESI
ncbi:hypothetical protein E4U09_003191 [Claviceps aff. purpurea]|uniref:non-specific serine/threonine protein kinase n=1 Tax=Claviceps aff. purpurea TaxID=1967640 RepID=A0A9P7QQD6_9HYPO|nr:hypothetical protein E4U09_003191 [Claviceps aff. purpurea]